MSNLNELADRYSKLTRQPVDGRWSEATLARKVQEAEKRQADELQAAERIERKKEKLEEERLQRVRSRGSFNEFEDRNYRSEDQDDRLLAMAVGHAQRVILGHAKVTQDLAEKFFKDPQHAMGWSMGYFDHAAKYTVAMKFKEMFENGVSLKEMQEVAMHHVMRGSSNPVRSTAPTSNLAGQCELEAWAEFAECLNGSRYF